MDRTLSAMALALFVFGCTKTQDNDVVVTDTGGLESSPDRDPKSSTAQTTSALELLETHCYGCHGQNGTNEGGLDYILDIERLIQAGRIVPGKASESRLFQRIEDEEMPPAGIQTRLTNKEIRTIRDWINVDLTEEIPVESRAFISTAEEFSTMRQDLDGLSQGDRRFIRYISLAHLYNADVLEDELETYRAALSVLFNRLSWSYEVVPLTPIDTPRNTLYRLDLRDYAWDDGSSLSVSSLWDTLIEQNPYAMLHLDTDHALEVVTMTRTSVPMIRGDWFAAKAASAPLYYDLLGIPENLEELESEFLLVDPEANLERLTAMRAGFTESGVSEQNRVIERHSTVFGAYWKSYDFAPYGSSAEEARDLENRNILDHPLGPGDSPSDFRPNGGEMIFELPNGLHGYMITEADGTRINSAPQAIVADPDGPAGAVVAGLSCMKCHEEGLIPKEDQVRGHVLANSEDYSPSDQVKIEALYTEVSTFLNQLEDDKDRYAEAVEAAGGKIGEPDPTLALVREFEAVLDKKRAAAELGLTKAQLEVLLLTPEIGDLLNTLRSETGTVSRDVFNDVFNDLACLVNFGLPINESEDCEPPDYQGNRVRVRLDETRTAQTRTEPLPARLED